jgi:hypothetical protein
MIAVHGVWSWMSDENRARIVDLVHRQRHALDQLQLYAGLVSDGAARHLMLLHAALAGSKDEGITRKIGAAIEFTQRRVDSSATASWRPVLH